MVTSRKRLKWRPQKTLECSRLQWRGSNQRKKRQQRPGSCWNPGRVPDTYSGFVTGWLISAYDVYDMCPCPFSFFCCECPFWHIETPFLPRHLLLVSFYFFAFFFLGKVCCSHYIIWSPTKSSLISTHKQDTDVLRKFKICIKRRNIFWILGPVICRWVI